MAREENMIVNLAPKRCQFRDLNANVSLDLSLVKSDTKTDKTVEILKVKQRAKFVTLQGWTQMVVLKQRINQISISKFVDSTLIGTLELF